LGTRQAPVAGRRKRATGDRERLGTGTWLLKCIASVRQHAYAYSGPDLRAQGAAADRLGAGVRDMAAGLHAARRPAVGQVHARQRHPAGAASATPAAALHVLSLRDCLQCMPLTAWEPCGESNCPEAQVWACVAMTRLLVAGRQAHFCAPARQSIAHACVLSMQSLDAHRSSSLCSGLYSASGSPRFHAPVCPLLERLPQSGARPTLVSVLCKAHPVVKIVQGHGVVVWLLGA